MLKIKDNVDLVELEKIGFKKQHNNYIYSLISAEIAIDIKDKTIDTLILWQKRECTELLSRENTTMEELKCFLPVLIDLVEEVKEDIKC